ncbi:MAG: glycosyltransferase [Xanthomonadaceae bacterium]|nr:glycosyltransferase [Xanthomonadaceae bacterium]
MRALSIVLPVGPDDRAWPPLRTILRTHAGAAQSHWVFAEGDPQEAPADALHVAPGRAAQQNAGAAATQRRWLWFLHADSRPDEATFAALRDFIARDEAALGWFRLRFDDAPTPALRRRMRLNAAGANWRSRRLGLPFGDQGLVLPRAAFERLGGFDPRRPYGEDLALVRHARRIGLPLRELQATLGTSARKYAERGWWRTTARHLWLTAVLTHSDATR